MSINVVVLDGVVKSLALRYDADAKAELRFTLQATDHATDGKSWTSFWPCCASGHAATRLAEEIENGMHIALTSAKLCYRKRATKLGEQSRLEVLVWQAEVLAGAALTEHEHAPEYVTEGDAAASSLEAPQPVAAPPTKKGKLRTAGPGWKSRLREPFAPAGQN